VQTKDIELMRSKVTESSAWLDLRVATLVLALVLAAGAPAAPAQTTPAVNSVVPDLGARTYVAHCASCHQEMGQGVRGAFPPLAGQIPNLLSQASGRDYLIRVMLFGLEGATTVNGESFVGVMPAWTALDDGDIAAVLNHLATAWDNKRRLQVGFEPFQASDISAARPQQMSAMEVHALRETVVPQPQPADPNMPAGNAPTFTAAQAAQGKTAYAHSCQDCHGSTLDNGDFGGAPLRGSLFLQHWTGGSVANLYAYTKGTMPPDQPGGLSDKVYADLVAFILQANEYHSGDKELPTDPKAQESMSLRRD
jgi:mono/diheme cytochrome c family protein